jgi:oxygen-independent coproporphyrinogen-3 oxidase
MLVYIHIPFCDSKCHYCSFNSYVDKFHLKTQYMEALHTQLLFELQRFQVEKNSIESIFIGGGTPSTVAPALYEKIFATLQPYIQSGAEITTEANPNSATKEWIEGMYTLGVNRISFGVQSFNTQKLKLLNRAHSPKQAQQSIENAAHVGIKNISLDLIYAVAGDTKELLENDLQSAFALPINHLSAYALTIEENTPFATTPHVAKEQLELTKWLFHTITQHHFPHYEISNFGSYQSVHNLGYWRYKDYIGVGSGAVGKLRNNRLYPTTHVEAYIKDPLTCSIETISKEEMIFEKIFLGFRSIVGVHKELLSPKQQQKADTLVQEKKLTFSNQTYYNNDFLLADAIALYLD